MCWLPLVGLLCEDLLRELQAQDPINGSNTVHRAAALQDPSSWATFSKREAPEQWVRSTADEFGRVLLPKQTARRTVRKHERNEEQLEKDQVLEESKAKEETETSYPVAVINHES